MISDNEEAGFWHLYQGALDTMKIAIADLSSEVRVQEIKK